jgi:predicted TPR repeat methyltransferase
MPDRFAPAQPPPRSEIATDEGVAASYDALLGLYHAGAFDQARERCSELIALAPTHAGALQLMGVLQARSGDFETAVGLFDRAIAAEPDVPSTYNNRGHALLALDHPAQALASYDQAIALQLENPHALNNRGTALQSLLRLEEALASYARAVVIEPGLAEAHLNRGELLLEIGERDAAIEALQRARATGGDSEKIGFTLASLGVEPPADAAPAAFVRELFDGYAQRFDRHLSDRLGYQVPALVAQAVAGLGLPQPVDIIDLGCGTGLCGPLLRAHARHLEGVDLSNNMLERAHRLEAYDNLVCEELVAHLERRPQAFDLAVAADVLIYIGELSATFAAVHRALRPGGWFVLSIEVTGEAAFVLGATRRYAHSRAYVESVARAQGFTVHAFDDVVLRQESRVDVNGQLVTLRRA